MDVNVDVDVAEDGRNAASEDAARANEDVDRIYDTHAQAQARDDHSLGAEAEAETESPADYHQPTHPAVRDLVRGQATGSPGHAPWAGSPSDTEDDEGHDDDEDNHDDADNRKGEGEGTAEADADADADADHGTDLEAGDGNGADGSSG